MSISKRLLLLLLVFVLSFGLFSVPVHALDIDFSKLKASSQFYIFWDGSENWMNPAQSWMNDGQVYTHEVSNSNVSYNVGDDPYIQHRLVFSNVDGSPLLGKGDVYQIIIKSISYTYSLTDGLDGTGIGDALNLDDLTNIAYQARYVDGSYSGFRHLKKDEEVYYTGNGFTFDFLVGEGETKSIDRIFLLIYFDQKYFSTDQTFTLTATATANPFIVTGDSIDPNTGILSGISDKLGGISNLIDGVLGFVKNIKEKTDSIFDAILNLPSKIWEFIENGLKSLFIPSDEYLAGLSDRWDSLLSERFGAIYEVGDLVHTIWEDLSASDKQDTIKIPVVDLSTAGIPFSFGGYDVQIVPPKFSVLVGALKKIISIIATCLFINGLLKRYDEVMGVER